MRFWLAVAILCWPLHAPAQLPPQEDRFITVLVTEYQILGIAEHYCRAKMAKATGLTQASYRWVIDADIPRMRGDLEAFEQAVQELAKKYPKHPRAGRSRLDYMKSQMDRLTTLWETALKESDLAKRKELLKQLVSGFDTGVRPGFTALIKDLNESVKNAGVGEFGEIKDMELALLRNESEYVWILALVRFARFMDVEGYREKREKALHEALDAAMAFVDNRADFFVLRYMAQLQRGLCHAELGDFRSAASVFSTLFNITAPVPPDAWDRALILKICEIRLQAYLHAMRSYNKARQFSEAAAVSERLFQGQRPPFNLTVEGPKEVSLRPFWVEAQLEAGVALAGVGRPTEGADLIQGVINKYKLAKADRESQTYVQKARSALARMVLVAGSMFPPDVILEAGKGYKSELKWVEARRIFQFGLSSVRTPEDAATYLPLLLSEIAECSHLAGQLREAMLASLTALRHFATSETIDPQLRQRLANYALAAADQLRETETNPAFNRLYDEATDFFRDYGNPAQKQVQVMIEGTELKNDEEFAKARERFLSVAATYDHQGVTKPFNDYWRSRAEAADCLYREYLAAKKEEKDDAKKREQAEEELKGIIIKALKAEPPQLSGAAAGVHYLASLYMEEGNRQPKEALRYLQLFDKQLKDEKEYRDQGLYNYVMALAHLDMRVDAYRRFLRLRKEYPESVEWARAAFDLFYFYEIRGDAKAAARYADAYLAHPLVKGSAPDDELLFAMGQVMADSEEEQFVPRAREIFQRFVDSDDRNKKIVARNGLVKIAIAEKRYEEAIKLGKELLKLEQAGDAWAPQVYRDMMRALVKLGLKENRAGMKSEALKHLKEAAEYMTKVVRLVNSARNDARNNGDAEKYQELTIVYYRYYHELLVIWKSLRLFKRVNGHVEMLLDRKPTFLPADLLAKYEETREEVREALKLPQEKK